jgi:hypothetical protein
MCEGIAFPKTTENSLSWPFCAEFPAALDPEVTVHDSKWEKRTIRPPNS